MMKAENNNLQVARWTDDFAQCEEFLAQVGPRIKDESKYMAFRYGVGMYYEDIASEIQAELWQQRLEIDTVGPFAKESPKQAADFLLGGYRIHERARTIARRIAKRQSKQADELADVRQPDLPQDIATQLLDIAKGLPRIFAEIPNFTPRDRDISSMELLRQVGFDDLPEEKRDQVAQAAGVSSSKQSAFCEYYDQNGHLSPSDRKAWSRAFPKIRALPQDKFKSLLVIVLAFALSLGLGIAIDQGRSRQNALAHQETLIRQDAVAHQETLIEEDPAARQGNLIRNALAHQPT
jgi:hypothetical protein